MKHERTLKEFFEGVPEYTCDWQTANTLTDHEIVKCKTEATHQINDPDEPGVTHLCLAHADLYRTITKKKPDRIRQ
jgi:hypothetical protein